MNWAERDKRDALELKLMGDMRHDGAGPDRVHRATAAPCGIGQLVTRLEQG